MSRLTRYALERPSLTYLVAVALLVAGVLAALSLNLELVPPVEFPVATVITVWPGASADEVTRSVVKPMEKALENLPEVDVVDVTSQASESFAAVTVNAEVGTKQTDLRDAIQSAIADVDFPDDAAEPDVVMFSLADIPLLQASVSGDIDLQSLQRLAEDELVPELEAVEGVSRVTVAGGAERKLFLTVDAGAMAEAGLTLSDIKNLLAANDLAFPVGAVSDDGRAFPIVVRHRLTTADDVRDLVLRPAGGGRGPGGPGGPGGPPGPGGPSPGAETMATTEARPVRATPTIPSPSLPAQVEPTTGPEVAEGPEGATGPFPLPPQLQALGYETTDDLTPELVRQLRRDDPDLLRTVAEAIIDSLPPGAAGALSVELVQALPEDLQSRLFAKVGGFDGRPPRDARAGQGPAQAPAGPPVTVLTVPAGLSIGDIAAGLKVSAAALRRANDLKPGQDIPAGGILTIPLAMVPALADEWDSLYGVTSASDITADIMAQALAETPDLVMGLGALQLVALPVESFQRLPVSLLVQLPQAVRLLLLGRAPAPSRAAATRAPRVLGRTTATAVSTRRATRRPTREPTARPTATPAPTRTPRPSPTPGPITLGDVAKVEVAPADLTILNRTDGEASLGLIVAKESQANTVAVADRVDDRLDELLDRRDLAGISVTKVFEQAPFVRESINGVVREGLLGGLFAVLVIFLFLNRSVRSTVIVALSIPLSVFVGTLLMRVQGLTLNMITLGGITVAIGRVVDDAIVVLENIYRHLQRGERRLDAVLVGTSEVATAITASTLVAVAVFLPLGLVGGLTRQFFLPMALTITYALLASLGVATTVVPTLTRSFLSRRSLPEDRETWLQRLYTPVLEWCLGHRGATLLLAIVFFVASLGLARVIPVTFLPGFGPPSVSVTLKLAPGTRLETTDDVARQVEDVLMARGDVETVQTTVGVANPFAAFFGMASGNQSSAAFLQAALVEDFDGDVNDLAAEIRDDLSDLDTARPMTATVRSGDVHGPEGGGFDLLLKSDSEADLRAASTMALEALGDADNWKSQDDDDGNRLEMIFGKGAEFDTVPFVNLESNLTASQRVLAVEVDPEAALANGLTTVQVAMALREVLEDQDLGSVELVPDGDSGPKDGDGRPVAETLSVIARYPAGTIDSLDGLADFEVRGPGGAVRLGDIAEVTEAPGPVQITRVDGSRAAIITADILEEDTIRVQQRGQEIVEQLRDLPDSVSVQAGANSASQQDAFKDMFAALGVAVVIAYFVLVVTFGSLVHPFTVLFSLPFALSGALIALAVTGRVLSVSSLIGLLMLIGIVLANAIVLIDLVQQYRQRGMAAHEALMRGGRVRLRPILMTATATVLALIPLALGLTEGAIIAAELATVVIGGLITSTILTLIIVPVMYSLLDRLAHRGEPAA